MSKNWYKHWFSSKEYLDVYSHRNDEDSEMIVNLILSAVDLGKGSSVLDAACGTGRHSINFAKSGYHVVGFDLSSTLLNIAEKESKRQSLDIIFKYGDLRTFYMEQKFDIVVSLFTSFGYFDSDGDNFIFVNNAYKMLNPSGYYVLDYFNTTFLKKNLIESTNKSIGDKEIVEKRRISRGRVIKRIRIKKQNEYEEYTESVKLYSYDDLIERFSEIGFREYKTFGDYNGTEYNQENSERCIIIFRKS